MDPVYIAIAFAFGFLIKQIKMPPLLGFLIAGFVLKLMGVENSETLKELAEVGILLLLFSIGLKLNIKSLLKPVIWGGTIIQVVISEIVFSLIIFIFGWLGISHFFDLEVEKVALIAFTLTFSSTVFVIKILEEHKATSSMYGKIAIGILVMQDIIAVLFLTIANGKAPNIYALALLPLVFVPQLVNKITFYPLLNRSGHGELLVLLGILIPLGGAYLFEITGLKPDLGALVFGVLLSGHPKAKELSKAMMSFKDLFLVGFFLTIGLTGLPTLEMLGISLLLNLILPIKSLIYFFILSKFKLSARTSFFSSITLTNFSEFGLIVGSFAMMKGWLPTDWMIIFALTISFSFVFSSPLNIVTEKLFERFNKKLKKFEAEKLIVEERPIHLGDVEVVILGIGKIGTTVYRFFTEKGKYKIAGIEIDFEKVKRYRNLGFEVHNGDITDLDFWTKVQGNKNVKLIIFTVSNHFSITQAVTHIKSLGIEAKTAALYKYDDEKEYLKEIGIDIAYDVFSEAGLGYGEQVLKLLKD